MGLLREQRVGGLLREQRVGGAAEWLVESRGWVGLLNG